MLLDENKWPEYVQRSFDIIPKNSTKENAFYGAWTKLLHHFFPCNTDFIITPQGAIDSSRDTVDFTARFDVRAIDDTIIVLAIELKPEYRIDDPGARRDADTQMRRRLYAMRYECPLTTIYGLSVFGTYFCVYKMDKMVLSPPFITDTTMTLTPIPVELWKDVENDVCHPDGRARLVDLIMNLKKQLATYLRDSKGYRAPVRSPLSTAGIVN
ncbi:hypothetical protein B0H11DRAFT_1700093 [Mycena galericulata]|nr:hypothetical protein B0H11DRAFT_1700093 [Mycena galericulata]